MLGICWQNVVGWGMLGLIPLGFIVAMIKIEGWKFMLLIVSALSCLIGFLIAAAWLIDYVCGGG